MDIETFLDDLEKHHQEKQKKKSAIEKAERVKRAEEHNFLNEFGKIYRKKITIALRDIYQKLKTKFRVNYSPDILQQLNNVYEAHISINPLGESDIKDIIITIIGSADQKIITISAKGQAIDHIRGPNFKDIVPFQGTLSELSELNFEELTARVLHEYFIR